MRRVPAASVMLLCTCLGDNPQWGTAPGPTTAGTSEATDSTSSDATGSASSGATSTIGHLFVLGGSDLSTMPRESSPEVFVSEVYADGSLGTWTIAPPMNLARDNHGSFQHAGRVYVVGGHDVGSYTRSIESALTTSGAVEFWFDGNDGPISGSFFGATAIDGVAVLVGGYGDDAGGAGSIAARSYVAPIGDDGSIQPPAWQSGEIPYRTRVQLVGAQGHAFMIGGAGQQDAVSPEVWRAPVSADGDSVGPWELAGSMATARWGHCATVTGDRIVVVGGKNEVHSVTGSAEVGLIDANLGLSWTSVLPAVDPPRDNPACAAIGDYVYVIGGLADPGVALADVHIARLEGTSFTRWDPLPPLPGPRSGPAAEIVAVP